MHGFHHWFRHLHFFFINRCDLTSDKRKLLLKFHKCGSSRSLYKYPQKVLRKFHNLFDISNGSYMIYTCQIR